MTMTLTPKQKNVLEKVLALRHLTKTGGMITRKSQGELLASLNATELAEVSQQLMEHLQQFGW